LLDSSQVRNDALTDQSDRFQYLLLGRSSPLNSQQKMIGSEALGVETQLLDTIIWAAADEPLIP
jgi:hypothetical protein